MVQPDLSILGDPSVFVIGDAAALYDEHGQALPALAPVAMQQARYVAKIIRSRIPSNARRPFLFHDKGTMATIGRAKAVAAVGTVSILRLDCLVVVVVRPYLFLDRFSESFSRDVGMDLVLLYL